MQIVAVEDRIVFRRPNHADVVLSVEEGLRLTESQDLRQAVNAAKQFGAEARNQRITELENELRQLRSLR